MLEHVFDAIGIRTRGTLRWFNVPLSSIGQRSDTRTIITYVFLTRALPLDMMASSPYDHRFELLLPIRA
ncbi:hypothetical protein M404DRAFT_528031 [Pisolithus tinctorius Marx 270]|nr:hypothetical protein M404DRAFT_528031 [Pisolithus tinctorius Marx 270]